MGDVLWLKGERTEPITFTVSQTDRQTNRERETEREGGDKTMTERLQQ